MGLPSGRSRPTMTRQAIATATWNRRPSPPTDSHDLSIDSSRRGGRDARCVTGYRLIRDSGAGRCSMSDVATDVAAGHLDFTRPGLETAVEFPTNSSTHRPSWRQRDLDAAVLLRPARRLVCRSSSRYGRGVNRGVAAAPGRRYLLGLNPSRGCTGAVAALVAIPSTHIRTRSVGLRSFGATERLLGIHALVSLSRVYLGFVGRDGARVGFSGWRERRFSCARSVRGHLVREIKR